MLYKVYKKCRCILFPFLALLVVISFVEPKEDEKSKYFELENGLKVFLYQRATLPLVNVSVSVNLGTKDETEESNGLVHILEHSILFGGTNLRSGEEVSQDIRRHGAYFNAHTDLDLVTFDISLPSEYTDFALNNQKEILFDLKLSQEEIDREKKVILEEIAQLKDDALRFATSLVFQNLFQNHPYQYPIFGKKEVIEQATSGQLEKFYHTHFVPSNCALSVVGDFIMEEMEEKTKAIFGGVRKGEFSPPQYEKSPFLEKSIEIEHEMDINLGYMVIGMPGPNYNHPDQYAVDVLVQILGRGTAPMIGYALWGTRKLAHNAYMSYFTHKYGGAIFIYIFGEPKNLKAARAETIKFLKNTRNERFSKEDFIGEEKLYALDFLESAKNNLKLTYYQGRERNLDVASSLSRYLLLTDNSSQKGFLENIQSLTSSDLRKAAGKYLSRGKYVIVSVIPKKDK